MDTVHVLLIDDAEPQRYLIEGYLSQSQTFRTELMWAASLVEAIRLLRFNTFDICLLDYQLGSHNALDVLNYFKAERIILPVIVLTGYGSQDIDLSVMDAGALDYLNKSELNTSLLERAIRYTVQQARAVQQGLELAALEERQRLARELHDVVSQTLFSASVMADSLTHMTDVDDVQLRVELERLAHLNRSALAEMRALLIELRPQAIVSIPLPELLGNLVSGMRGRSSGLIMLEILGNPIPLTPEVHHHFYRLMQEILTNSYKHARAREIRIGLHYLDEAIELIVADDGIGFDLNDVPPDHHGLRIMRERAEQIRATLHIETAIGEGSYTHITWPIP